MNLYVTADAIRALRDNHGLTQAQLAEQIGVTDKAISKWETGRGLPDITLLEPLAAALGVSVTELLSGECITNTNRHANVRSMKFYVCPVCGNVITSLGEGSFACCGVQLMPLEAEKPDDHHVIVVEPVENEHYVTINHPMTKQHYISFLALVTSDRCQLVKLYPEGPAEARFFKRGHGRLYAYCNHHGLFYVNV